MRARRIAGLQHPVLACAGGWILMAAATGPASAMPAFEEVRQGYQRTEVLIVDRQGEILQSNRVDYRARRVDWAPLETISPAMATAVLQAEDRRFFEHAGVDWRAVGGSLWAGLSTGMVRGASTISMQVAGLLAPDLHITRGHKTLSQKWDQVRAAWELEGRWSKPQILEAYLNLVSFRGEWQGIVAAARALFRKDVHGLTDAEAVILAALIRAPNAAPSRVAQRACVLARDVGWALSCEGISRLATEALLHPGSIPSSRELAPHAARWLLHGQGTGEKGQTVRTTLDRRLQHVSIEILRKHLLAIRDQRVQDGAVLVADNATGEVLAYVGSSAALSSAPFVDGVRAFRQAGSTLKPFVYASAFEGRLLTPASILDDSPVAIGEAVGVYRPQNYDYRYRGPVTVRVALASSLNIPAVRAVQLLGPERVADTLRRLGLVLKEEGNFYGPALALGSADTSLWSLVNAYRTLAEGGFWSEMTLVPRTGAPVVRQPIFSPETAFLISDILADREARSETFDLENALASPFWTAVKTGTSKDMRDNWCVGYSNRYTVGVWVGNFSAESMWDVSGVTGAAPVWSEIMGWLHREEPSVPKAPPQGVMVSPVADGRVGMDRKEWFLKGTEPERASAVPLQAEDEARIVYPADGSVIALDPDMPIDREQLFFEARPRSRELWWSLDGEELGRADRLQLWRPQPGAHTVRLMDRRHRVLDQVRFHVRGTARGDDP